MTTKVTGNEIVLDTDGTLAANSNTAVASQRAIKTYADTKGTTLGTLTPTTSGASIDFTGIPSTAKEIKITFDNVSTNGTSVPIIQIGSSSGGIESSGYTGAVLITNSGGTAGVALSSGFALNQQNAATYQYSGVLSLVLMDAATNKWAASSVLGNPTTVQFLAMMGGVKALTSTLDRIRLTTAGGTDTFDGGNINIAYSS